MKNGGRNIFGKVATLTLSVAAILIIACGDSRGSSWSERTHGSRVEPNFKEVFSDNKLRRIDITISAEDWSAMWADLDSNLMMMGGGGRGGMMPPQQGGEMMGGRPEGGMPPEGAFNGGRDSMMMGGRGGMMGERRERGEMMGGRGGMMGERGERGERGGRGGMMGGGGDPATQLNDFTPMWVSCTLSYNGIEWQKVGVRFKGNSSLQRAYGMRSDKLSLKLDFDQFENEYPELKNQRFYGFKQLNLNNNLDDYSFMREKVVSDMFRDFGLAAAHTSFCEVYLTYDDTGAKFVGIYTLVEEVDDTVIETQFSDNSGNVYKPESPAGSFAEGSYNTELFYLKNNKKSCDYSDIKALYDILNSDLRTSDETKWKRELESVFDVDVFLKWLAGTKAIQNWDTYGSMAHNYYLYNNPKNNLLTWIPWDHNEALQQGKGRNVGDIADLTQTNSSWPLISYLLATKEYKDKFNKYLSEFTSKVFNPSRMSKIYDGHYKTLKEATERELSGGQNNAAFDRAVESLKTHVQSRNEVVNNYLKNLR